MLCPNDGRPTKSISTTTEWVALKHSKDIHGPQRTTPNNFENPLTFCNANILRYLLPSLWRRQQKILLPLVRELYRFAHGAHRINPNNFVV